MANANGNTRTCQAQNAVRRENPYFRSIERGSYEVGQLLRNLPARAPLSTDDDRQMAEAAAQHAGNGIDTLLHGLEAIGALMVDLGGMAQYQMDASKVSALGDLIRHISVEVQFLHDTKMGLQEEMCAGDQKGGA